MSNLPSPASHSPGSAAVSPPSSPGQLSSSPTSATPPLSSATTPPSNSQASASVLDKVYQRLIATFSPSSDVKKKDTKITTSALNKIDDNGMDLLYELDSYLATATNTPVQQGVTQAQASLSLPSSSSELSRCHSGLLRLLIDKVIPRSGESYPSRQLCARCLTALMEHNSNTLAHVYSDMINLMQHKEQNPRLAGMTCFAYLSKKFGQQFVLNTTDVVNILTKLSKRDELVCKSLVLSVINHLYIGTGGPRSTDSNSADILKIVVALAKSAEKALRCSTAETIQVIMENSSDGREVDQLLPICVRALLDSDLEVRYVNADVLGAILFACTAKDLSRVSEAVRKKRLIYEVKNLDDALNLIQKLFAKAPQSTLKASLSVCLTRLMRCAQQQMDDTHVTGYVMTIIGFVFKTKGADSEREGRQLVGCITDALIHGILSIQSQHGLELIAKSILHSFHHATTNSELNEYQIMVGCDCLSYIFQRLAAAMEHLDIKDSALDVLLALLASPSVTLRVYAAQCFRALARAASSHIATWLAVVEKIVAIQLSEVFDGGRGREEDRSVDVFWSLHGHMSAMSAVVGVIPECCGGVSISMLDSVFEVAKRLINVDERVSIASNTPYTHLNECGWMLLSSLIGLGSEWVAPRLNTLFNLWRNVLGKTPPSTPQKVDDIAADLRVRGKALIALRSFVHIMRHRIQVLGPNQFSPVLKAVRVFLGTNFSLMKALQSAKDLEPVILSALMNVKPVLMDIFTALPPASFNSMFSRILKFIVAEFTTNTPPAATELQRLLNPADNPLLYPSLALPALLRFADLQEADPMYGGEAKCAGGNIAIDYTWNWCLRPDSYTYSKLNGREEEGRDRKERREDSEEIDGGLTGRDSDSGSTNSHNLSYAARNNSDCYGLHAYECYESGAVRSTNACIRLFAAIFADQSPTYKEQLMKHLLALIQKAKQANGLASNTILNIAAAVLAVCRDQNQRECPIGAPNALTTIVSISSDLLASPSPVVRRAAGEMFGLLVHIENDSLLSSITSVLRDQLSSKDVNVLCGSVFAFGCVHRYGGGMKTIRSLTFTVASLQLMGRDFTEPLRLWILHALWLAVDTGGLSFASYAQPTLSILWSHAMHDSEQRAPLLTLTIGRILHAVIAAFGPEVNPLIASSSSAQLGVDRFLHLWSHLQCEQHSLVQVQVIETANQLVLWNAITDEDRLVSLLERGLNDEQDELRRCSVKCVLRWGEKDVRLIHKHSFEKKLMNTLDKENVHHIAALIRHTFHSFIKLHTAKEATNQSTAGTPSPTPAMPASSSSSSLHSATRSSPVLNRPTRWYLLDVFKRAIVGWNHKLPSDGTAAPASSASLHPTQKAHKEQTNKDDDDEDEDDKIVTSGASAGKGDSTASNGAASSATSTSSSPTTGDTRWQTKAFALDCLSLVLRTAKHCVPANEFDLSFARKNNKYPCQFLVQQLVDLLTVACMATSSSYDCLRIRGALTMLNIVRCFQDVIDPDGEGELLLQMYSAQVTSALSASMKNKSESIGSAPQLRAAACELSVVYLLSGVTDDGTVIQRMMKMLLAPLQRPNDVAHWYAQYDGNMATMVLLSHLSALAQLHLACIDKTTAAVTTTSTTTVGSKKKTAKLQPRHRALQAVADVLHPQFDWLQQQYFSALKDYALVSVTQKKDMQKTKGTFFDGATATRVMDVFQPLWDVFLTVTAASLKERAEGGDDLDQYTKSKQPLLLLGIIISTLHTIYAFEILAINRRRPVLEAALSEQEKQREQKQVLACLDAIPSLFQPPFFIGTHEFTVELLAELLSLLGWSLQYRLNADSGVVQPRQAAAVVALGQLLDALNSATLNPHQALQSPSSVSMPDLLHSISELLSVCVYQHLPLPAQGTGAGTARTSPIPSLHSPSTGTRSSSNAQPFLVTLTPSLADQSNIIIPETQKFLSSILRIIPQHVSLIINAMQAQKKLSKATPPSPSALSVPFPLPVSVYVTAASHLCLHVIRRGDAVLADLAALSLRSVFIATINHSLLDQDHLLHSLLSELHSYLAKRHMPEFRLQALMRCVWFIAASPPSTSAASAATDLLTSSVNHAAVNKSALAAAADIFQTGINSEEYTAITQQVLKEDVFTTDSSASASLMNHYTQPASELLFAHLLAILCTRIHQAQDETTAVNMAQLAYQALNSLTTQTSTEQVLQLLIPCVIHALSVAPSLLQTITTMAAAHPALFKLVVAGLSNDDKTMLQSLVLATQQSATSSSVSTTTVDQSAETKASRSRDKSGKKKKHRGSDGGSGATLHLEDQISLSTDFAAFGKKKEGSATSS